MKYTRISIKFDEFEDRFNRTILVKENVDLFKFETFLAFILDSTFEHLYLIYTRNEEFVTAPFMMDALKRIKKYSGNYQISDLPKNFEFVYDLGDYYSFKCRKEGYVEIDSRKTFILESAKGQGIWEDNIYSLCAYLSGEIKPSKRSDDEDEGYYLPWNFNNKTFGDFDKEIDIEKENERISEDFPKVLAYIKKCEKEYIIKNNISLDDIEPNGMAFNAFKKNKESVNDDVSSKKA